ncbi:hypothetical protein PTI45_04090 [Paenibacillus nuruki]|uniref:Uncharacterized protein n=1 Tax=Paenibacillus nuruki TaxID=1886670 RepID=A0A1E3KZW2_9BACL|nr:hypothetical protein PTI45_04090 [Paenibacillus nuruki]
MNVVGFKVQAWSDIDLLCTFYMNVVGFKGCIYRLNTKFVVFEFYMNVVGFKG